MRLLADRGQMERPLELLSNVLPLTYADDALRHVADRADVSTGVVRDLTISLAMAFVALGAGAITLRRRTP